MYKYILGPNNVKNVRHGEVFKWGPESPPRIHPAYSQLDLHSIHF